MIHCDDVTDATVLVHVEGCRLCALKRIVRRIGEAHVGAIVALRNFPLQRALRMVNHVMRQKEYDEIRGPLADAAERFGLTWADVANKPLPSRVVVP